MTDDEAVLLDLPREQAKLVDWAAVRQAGLTGEPLTFPFVPETKDQVVAWFSKQDTIWVLHPELQLEIPTEIAEEMWGRARRGGDLIRVALPGGLASRILHGEFD